ncbi:hypothetical protein R1flu_006571 [Riccia fluitans]|uniref:Uncharacterized protein n=1 Tax=Riccia fluitans TaxID=41844 RepID=A0ABD1Z0G4_9MARC
MHLAPCRERILTPGWNTQLGTSDDPCLLTDEVMPTKPQTDKGEDGCSIPHPGNGEPKMSEAHTPKESTPQQPSTTYMHVKLEGVDRELPGWVALDIPYNIKPL